ncbi:hypothetical protein PRIPAC_81650 [Pristionchus pacificus]|uniref:Uncharacterized protein n=1 Tax=Pristionchus pacificus TaxID=54126 RepID=A0A2A6CNC2_PRIPA|nr:hypothetical protein PRIPAC_81650 [Pristionchus pacificus]|eukprot:PDM79598.1 hypothetical protein PRIPAC_32177 [Pristionchus pacificus]
MPWMRLLLYWTLPLTVAGTCYVAQSETIRRAVIAVVSQTSQVGCQMLCTADANCQATVLNASGTACVHLGAPVADPATNVCPATATVYVKTETNCGAIPQGRIGDGYTPGECSRPTDVIGDLATDQSSPPCGTPPASQQRIVIDAIQHDGTHITLENYNIGVAVWDAQVGSWYIDLVDTPTRYYFKWAKCVLAPVTPLTPNCACAPLPTEPATAGYSNPSAPVMNTDSCCTSAYTQMSYLRVGDPSTFQSPNRIISCTMGVWMMIRTNAYNAFALSAATCVD